MVNNKSKCPKCGSTDIALNSNNGNLTCNYCKFEFSIVNYKDIVTELSELKGDVITSCSDDINDNESILTLHCDSCGADVVVDTSESTSAHCHWCRSVLSINSKVPNGAVADVILPFKTSKDQAVDLINKYVKERKKYANDHFIKEFVPTNVVGVYLPYVVVDINAFVDFSGVGERTTDSYTLNDTQYYSATVHNVSRKCNCLIKNLTLESSSKNLGPSKYTTNNILNSIMPFDTENSVVFDSNYLRGYTSEKRDLNIEDLTRVVETQSLNVAKFSLYRDTSLYDRGVRWDKQNFKVVGQQWKTAYFPVWLYSYSSPNGKVHYVAVNARTSECVGSVPIDLGKLSCFTLIFYILAGLFCYITDFAIMYMFLIIGALNFFFTIERYKNTNSRHNHEYETKARMHNLNRVDNQVNVIKKTSSSSLNGSNNHIFK